MKRMHPAALAVLAAFTFSSTAALGQEDSKKTVRLWKAKCSSCHGAGGAGDTEKGMEMELKVLSDPAWQASKKDDEIKKVIVEVRTLKVDGKQEEVHGYQDKLSAEQVDALVAHIRSFKK